MAIQWDKSLAVGVKLVDEQHQELFRRVNALLDAMLQAKGKDEVAQVLAFLKDYVVEHFGAEQKLMAQYKYPGLAQHKAQHDAFVKTFLEAKAEFDEKGPSGGLAIRLNSYLGAWLRDHIGSSDRAMGQFVAAHAGANATV
ncbi:MAG TPA: bacteriohemerythrin [Anaeromyxobacteraceae bacterium]|nr:bacteriohemerythrin [Anaeromyxobacteraceae bacterium]